MITFVFVFLVDKGIEEPFPAINGPPSARQRNAIKMAFRSRAADGPALNADLVALSFFRGSGPRIAKKPYIFVIFQGGGGVPDPCPPQDPPMSTCRTKLACLSQKLCTLCTFSSVFFVSKR